MSPSTDVRQSYSLQFVSAPTADTSGTIAMLHFDNKRYMFGRMAEGTQRACVQRGVGVKKVRNIFLTGTNTWKDNGGLIGFLLTLADQQLQEVDPDGSGIRPRLNIHGGPRLLHSLACARRFVFRTGVPLAVHESAAEPLQWPAEPSFEDENIRVWPIPLPGPQSPSTSLQSIDSTAQIKDDQAARRNIISNMFDSAWRRDRLFESPFADVMMPAKVWIRNPETKKLDGIQCTTMDDAPHIMPDQIVLVRNPWPASLVTQLPSASNLPSGVAMSYLVRGHRQRGTFDGKKAKALGVPNGPVRKDLINGESITLNNGEVITPEMVLSPSREAKGVVFFDLPTTGHLEHLDTLLSNTPDLRDDIATAVWILGPEVSASKLFKQVTHSLSTVDHFVSDPDTSPNILAFESVAASSVRLSDVSPTIFPAPLYDNQVSYDEKAPPENQEPDLQPNRPSVIPPSGLTTSVKAGLKVNLEPKYWRDETEVPSSMSINSVERPTSAVYRTAKAALDSNPIRTQDSPHEPEIITLGTGSALPSKYRNVSATLLRMPGKQGNYLFDCGENTMGQLRRMYNPSKLRDILINLKAIWISHLHADHHLGTISVLQERAAAFEKRAPDADRTLYLMSEQNMLNFIRDYSSVEPSLVHNTGLVPVECTQDLGPLLDGEAFDFSSQGSAIARVQTATVSHCAGAQAISITFKSGFKISYSGDCRPSRNFCNIGRDSNVLIHEATFDDDMEGDAQAKKHSTTGEALGVAMRMGAKNVVLTHFSQRYQKVPNLDNIKLPEDVKYEEGRSTGESGPIVEADGDATRVDDDNDVKPMEMVSDAIMDKQSAMSVGDFLNFDSATMTSPNSDKDAALLASLSASREQARHRRRASAARNMAVCVAFDYMRVRVSQIQECKKLYPALQAMFDEMEKRSEDRRATERERNEEYRNAKRQKNDKSQQGSGRQKKVQGANRCLEQSDEPTLAIGMNVAEREDLSNVKLTVADEWRESWTSRPKESTEGWSESLTGSASSTVDHTAQTERPSTQAIESHRAEKKARLVASRKPLRSRRRTMQLRRVAVREPQRAFENARLSPTVKEIEQQNILQSLALIHSSRTMLAFQVKERRKDLVRQSRLRLFRDLVGTRPLPKDLKLSKLMNMDHEVDQRLQVQYSLTSLHATLHRIRADVYDDWEEQDPDLAVALSSVIYFSERFLLPWSKMTRWARRLLWALQFSTRLDNDRAPLAELLAEETHPEDVLQELNTTRSEASEQIVLDAVPRDGCLDNLNPILELAASTSPGNEERIPGSLSEQKARNITHLSLSQVMEAVDSLWRDIQSRRRFSETDLALVLLEVLARSEELICPDSHSLTPFAKLRRAWVYDLARLPSAVPPQQPYYNIKSRVRRQRMRRARASLQRSGIVGATGNLVYGGWASVPSLLDLDTAKSTLPIAATSIPSEATTTTGATAEWSPFSSAIGSKDATEVQKARPTSQTQRPILPKAIDWVPGGVKEPPKNDCAIETTTSPPLEIKVKRCLPLEIKARRCPSTLSVRYHQVLRGERRSRRR